MNQNRKDAAPRRRSLLRLAHQEMYMLRHHHLTEEMKSHLVAHLPQLFHEDVPRPHRLQQRQSSIAAERYEMQVTFSVVALQSRWHRKSNEENVNPKTQVQKPNLGHPPPLYTSPRSAAVISSPSSSCAQMLFRSSPGHPPSDFAALMVRVRASA